MQTIEDWLSQLGLSKYMETDLGYRDQRRLSELARTGFARALGFTIYRMRLSFLILARN